MQSRIAALTMMVVLALVPTVFAGGKVEHKASISFHLEGEATDNPKMIFPQMMPNGQKRFFQRLHTIDITDIESFTPFPSEVGDGYGLVLTLKPGSVHKLSDVTSTNEGRWLLAQVNGRIVDAVMIDKPIRDGRVVIWQGVVVADITLLDSEMPRTGQEGKKKK